MEGGPRRDISELLTNGFFTTSRGKSPSKSSQPAHGTSSFLQTSSCESPRSRSRSRGPQPKPPPRPSVEDEETSLAKEFSSLGISLYDPPLRGMIDQNPIILEAEVTFAEVAILQAKPCPEVDAGNDERRFVLVPKSDTYEPNERDEMLPKSSLKGGHERSNHRQTRQHQYSKEEQKRRPTSTASDVRHSRQDLPSLQTKIPRDLPPQFRRSASAFASTPPNELDGSLKLSSTRTPVGDSFLSPHTARPGQTKDCFEQISQSVPRNLTKETFGGRTNSTAEKRHSGGSFSGTSNPMTPTSAKRNSATFEAATPRLGTNTLETPNRPQRPLEDFGARKSDRHPSTHSARSSGGSDRPRSPNPRPRQHYSSEDDLADSDSDDNKHNRHGHHKNLQTEGHRTHLRSPAGSNRSSVDGKFKPTSRHTSPLPSPKASPTQLPTASYFERSSTFPRDSRNPISRPVSPRSAQEPALSSNRQTTTDTARPRSRQSSAVPISDRRVDSKLPIPVPTQIDLHSPGETRRSPSIPAFDDARSPSARPDTGPKVWQPPPFQPPAQASDKAIGSYRRYSEDLEQGSVAPLPPCSRTSPTRGRNDWLTLPQCSDFDICPSCFKSIIAPTDFRSLFVLSPRRPPEVEVICDFGSSPWYRIAWLLTLKERRRDLKLFYGLANIAATIQPCLGKHEVIRQWYSILDPKTGSTIRNFDVCYSCVKSIETVLPDIRGIFIRSNSQAPSNAPRVCDLRFDSQRFIQYFDALETTADSADHVDGPDTRRFASLVRRLASIDECQQDTELNDRRWHIITQLPEFTVCPECFDEVIWPELDEEKPIPSMFNKILQRVSKASCQLYSKRMRAIFSKAVDTNDYKLLASRARERRAAELDFRANLIEVKRRTQGSGRELMEKEAKKVMEEWRKFE